MKNIWVRDNLPICLRNNFFVIGPTLNRPAQQKPAQVNCRHWRASTPWRWMRMISSLKTLKWDEWNYFNVNLFGWNMSWMWNHTPEVFFCGLPIIVDSPICVIVGTIAGCWWSWNLNQWRKQKNKVKLTLNNLSSSHRNWCEVKIL